MKRFAQLIRIKPGKIEEYRKYHAAVWPEVAKTIMECNITNYSIYHHDGLLFAYFEYVGDDYEADMAKMDADPMTQKWWAIQKPLQQPYENRKPDEWWVDMEEVFHQD